MNTRPRRFEFIRATILIALVYTAPGIRAEPVKPGVLYEVPVPAHRAICTATSMLRSDAESLAFSESELAKSVATIDKELSAKNVLTSGSQFLGASRKEFGQDERIVVELCVTVADGVAVAHPDIFDRSYAERRWWLTLCRREAAIACIDETYKLIHAKYPNLRMDTLRRLGWRFLLVADATFDSAVAGPLIANPYARPVPIQWALVRQGGTADDPKIERPVRGQIQLNMKESVPPEWGVLGITMPPGLK